MIPRLMYLDCSNNCVNFTSQREHKSDTAVTSFAQHDFDLATRACGACTGKTLYSPVCKGLVIISAKFYVELLQFSTCIMHNDSCLVIDSADSDTLLYDSPFKRAATASTSQHIGDMSTLSPSAWHDASAPPGA